jgi:hypothetical protein
MKTETLNLTKYTNTNVCIPESIVLDICNGQQDEIFYDIHWSLEQKAIYIEMARSLSLLNKPGDVV